MKKNSFLLIFFVFQFLIFSKNLNAQSYTAGEYVRLNVQDFCLIATNNAPINLNLTTNVAGAPVSTVSNSDMFVKISSTVPGGTHREITARIATGEVPVGTKLTLISAPCTTANSGGKLGTPVSTPIVLNSMDQILVDYIGSCYTGTGYNDGYQLTYTWSLNTPVANYETLQATTTPTALTIVLTITAHNSN